MKQMKRWLLSNILWKSDNRYQDELKHTDRIGGRPFSEVVVFQGNRYQIFSRVKQVL